MPKKRIDTQIPRRKKAPESVPMQSEWDEQGGSRATKLKMPADAMVSKKREPQDPADSSTA